MGSLRRSFLSIQHDKTPVIPRLVRGTSSILSPAKQRSPGSLLRIDRGMTVGSCRRAVGRLTPAWQQRPSHTCHPRRMSGAGRTHGGDPCARHQPGPGLAPGLRPACAGRPPGMTREWLPPVPNARHFHDRLYRRATLLAVRCFKFEPNSSQRPSSRTRHRSSFAMKPVTFPPAGSDRGDKPATIPVSVPKNP